MCDLADLGTFESIVAMQGMVRLKEHLDSSSGWSTCRN